MSSRHLPHQAKIPTDHLRAKKQIKQRTNAQKGTKRDGQPSPPSRAESHTKACCGSDSRSSKNREYDPFPTQESANHGKQLDVTPTHSLPFGQQIVTPRHKEKQAATQEETDQGVFIGDVTKEEGGDKSDPDAWQGDHVRNNLMINVNESDHQK